MAVLYKFVLHGIGLVLAIRTRNIEIDVLNDYKYTAALIYISTVLILVIAVVLPISYNNPALDELVYSTILFLILMLFMGLTFVPKVNKSFSTSRIFCTASHHPYALHIFVL